MGTTQNKVQSSWKLCTGKISSTVTFYHYFEVFHTKFDIDVARKEFFGICLKVFQGPVPERTEE